jgi:hypothetical protein
MKEGIAVRPQIIERFSDSKLIQLSAGQNI